ncbi:MAG: hypothetical protein A3K66_02685 [Euryarchaeota archaeon RBG_16_67_27]|nr:MAG: hypothetical protein A3K66_02685 [Euryarchaeota archaeon RBG_16_67_27]
MSSESSSIQKGSRRGRIGATTVIAIAVVLAAVGGVAAWYVLTPRGTFEIVVIDGSSTVYPITAAWASDFNNPQRQVTVAISGTGGGFQKFCRGETDLNDASRPIKQSERDMCAAHVPPITNITEFKIGYDGLTIVVPRSNDWVQNLTVKQLCRIWTSNTSAGACGGAGPHVTRWSELSASWPARLIKLYGPGTDSGTYDFFVEVILTPTGDRITSSFFSSEDDNILAEGVANTPDAIGYFGFAYYEQYAATLRSVPIDDEKMTNGAGPIGPSVETIKNGTYQPLSRPLFVYAHGKSLDRQVVKDFLRFGLSAHGTELVSRTGYVGLSPSELAIEAAKVPG